MYSMLMHTLMKFRLHWTDPYIVELYRSQYSVCKCELVRSNQEDSLSNWLIWLCHLILKHVFIFVHNKVGWNLYVWIAEMESNSLFSSLYILQIDIFMSSISQIITYLQHLNNMYIQAHVHALRKLWRWITIQKVLYAIHLITGNVCGPMTQ